MTRNPGLNGNKAFKASKLSTLISILSRVILGQ